MSIFHRCYLVVIFITAISFAITACSTGDSAQQQADDTDAVEDEDGLDESDPGVTDDDSGETAAIDGVPPRGEPADQEGEDVCTGQINPPRGAAGRAYFPNTAISDSTPFDELEHQARSELRDQICQGVLCDTVERGIQIWQRKEGGGYRCVMAIIERDILDEWSREVESTLPARLAERGHEPIDALRETTGNDTPRVTIAEITDHGVPGGPRAEWLHRGLERALDDVGAHVVPRRPDWSGYGVPDDVDGVVRAEITELSGTERPLEVSWKVRNSDRILRGEPLQLPEVATPAVDEASHLPNLDINDSELGLLFDSRDGGGLCDGQATELWLETAEDMYVRVLNLYGNRSGHAIFPATTDEDAFIPAGDPVSLGQFRAMRHGDIEAERFLVIASPDRESLERYASIDQFCRLPSSLAHELQHGRDLPGGDDVYFYETGFRLMDSDECDGFDFQEREREQILEIVGSAPTCWY